MAPSPATATRSRPGSSEAAIERRISSLDSTTPEDINRITVLRQQLQRLRPADTRARAARAAYELLSTH